MNLIDIDRAKVNIRDQTTFSTTDDATIEKMIAVHSEAIQLYLGRRVPAEDYKELYSGDGEQYLFLNQMPVNTVARCATGTTTVLQIENTNWPTSSRATVEVTSTGLTLKRVASGTTTTSTVAFATYTTINAVATQIDTLGNGWDATVPDSNYGTWASADLLARQGAMNAINGGKVELKIHTEEVDAFEILEAQGVLAHPYGWPRGFQNIRIDFNAGFKDVPEPIQAGCAIMVAGAYKEASRDPMTAFQKTADFSYNAAAIYSRGFPANVKRLIDPYIMKRIR